MNSELDALLKEAKEWLAEQAPAPQSSARWYALGNFRSFLDAIGRDQSVRSIEKAVHSLRHHIVDQFDWSADYCKVISSFCGRADRIRRHAKDV